MSHGFGANSYFDGTISDTQHYASANDKLDSIGFPSDTNDWPIGHQIWGHDIIISEGDVRCRMCDMSEEIPNLLKNTSGHRRAMYTMYILHSFKYSSCHRELPPDDPVTTTDVGDKMLWTNNTYTTNGTTTSRAINAEYKMSGTMSEDEKEEVKEHLLTRMKNKLF